MNDADTFPKIFHNGRIFALAYSEPLRILSHCHKSNLTHASFPEAMLISGTIRAPEFIDVIEPE